MDRTFRYTLRAGRRRGQSSAQQQAPLRCHRGSLRQSVLTRCNSQDNLAALRVFCPLRACGSGRPSNLRRALNLSSGGSTRLEPPLSHGDNSQATWLGAQEPGSELLARRLTAVFCWSSAGGGWDSAAVTERKMSQPATRNRRIGEPGSAHWPRETGRKRFNATASVKTSFQSSRILLPLRICRPLSEVRSDWTGASSYTLYRIDTDRRSPVI